MDIALLKENNTVEGEMYRDRFNMFTKCSGCTTHFTDTLTCRHIEMSIGSLTDHLFIRNIRVMTDDVGFKCHSGLISRPLLNHDEDVNVVTSSWLDAVYNNKSWKSIATLLEIPVYVKSGCFKGRLIYGRICVQFVGAKQEKFYIPCQVVLDAERSLLYITTKWLYAHYVYEGMGCITLAAACTDSKHLLIPAPRKAIEREVKLPDSWIPNRLVKYMCEADDV